MIGKRCFILWFCITICANHNHAVAKDSTIDSVSRIMVVIGRDSMSIPIPNHPGQAGMIIRANIQRELTRRIIAKHEVTIPDHILNRGIDEYFTAAGLGDQESLDEATKQAQGVPVGGLSLSAMKEGSKKALARDLQAWKLYYQVTIAAVKDEALKKWLEARKMHWPDDDKSRAEIIDLIRREAFAEFWRNSVKDINISVPPGYEFGDIAIPPPMPFINENMHKMLLDHINE